MKYSADPRDVEKACQLLADLKRDLTAIQSAKELAQTRHNRIATLRFRLAESIGCLDVNDDSAVDECVKLEQRVNFLQGLHDADQPLRNACDSLLGSLALAKPTIESIVQRRSVEEGSIAACCWDTQLRDLLILQSDLGRKVRVATEAASEVVRDLSALLGRKVGALLTIAECVEGRLRDGGLFIRPLGLREIQQGWAFA